jgi:hypothetical protein
MAKITNKKKKKKHLNKKNSLGRRGIRRDVTYYILSILVGLAWCLLFICA